MAVLVLPRPMKLRAVKVRFVGEEYAAVPVRGSSAIRGGSGGVGAGGPGVGAGVGGENAGKMQVESRIVFRHEQMLWTGQADVMIGPGTLTLPFRWRVPANAPGSFRDDGKLAVVGATAQGSMAEVARSAQLALGLTRSSLPDGAAPSSIEYRASLVLVQHAKNKTKKKAGVAGDTQGKGGAKDKDGKREAEDEPVEIASGDNASQVFTVLERCPPCLLQYHPVEATESKILMFGGSSPCVATVGIPNSTLVPGRRVPVELSITNGTDRIVSGFQVRLVRLVSFSALGRVVRKEATVRKERGGNDEVSSSCITLCVHCILTHFAATRPHHFV
jgi:hypothetical protein